MGCIRTKRKIRLICFYSKFLIGIFLFARIKFHSKLWKCIFNQDLGAHEDCVRTSSEGLWNDYYCGARYNYICGPGICTNLFYNSFFFKSNNLAHIVVLVSQYFFHYQCLLNGVSSSVIMNAMMNMQKLIALKFVQVSIWQKL